MFVLESELVVYFDVDETLISFDERYKNLPKKKIGPEGSRLDGYINEKLIAKIKEHRARNHAIVVWSAGGYQWALDVVTALKIEDHVDAVMAKPRWFYDDQPSNVFMDDKVRIHYRIDGSYVQTDGGYQIHEED